LTYNDGGSFLREKSLSRSAMECDLIRISRLEQERIRNYNKQQEKLFTDSKYEESIVEAASLLK
jgi:hypothetical protein